MKAYHIDRANLLLPNKTIKLDKTIKIDPEYLQIYLEESYPEGFSSHGDYHITRQGSAHNAGNVVYETIYEYERKLHFPNCLSRYQSFFGLESLEDVKLWLKFFSNNQTAQQQKFSIWEIDTLDSEVQVYDSLFLGGGDLNELSSFSALGTQYNAKKYWSGQMSENPHSNFLNHFRKMFLILSLANYNTSSMTLLLRSFRNKTCKFLTIKLYIDNSFCRRSFFDF